MLDFASHQELNIPVFLFGHFKLATSPEESGLLWNGFLFDLQQTNASCYRNINVCVILRSWQPAVIAQSWSQFSQSVTMFPANVSTVRSHENICWSVFSVRSCLAVLAPVDINCLSDLLFYQTLQVCNKIDNLIVKHLATFNLGQNIKMSSSRTKPLY